MLPESLPDRGPGEEPDGSPLPGEEWDGPEQGLFICLPAEELTLAGFAQDGRADTMEPGPLLATVVDTVTGDDARGLAGLSDDQLTGIISATQRLESRITWTRMAALAEYAARRPASRDQGIRCTAAPNGPDGISVFAADELARELHSTWQSTAEQMAYARAVTERLPRTFAALAAGRIHPVHLRIIEDETHVLAAADAARADEILAEAAQGRTFGEVRHAAHKLVLKLDPEAAQRRKEAAKRETHVRPFREASGNAGMVGREMPCDEVLASWQHVEQRALDLRAAGVPGSLRELRVRAYLDLLQERDSRTAPADPDVNDSPAENAGPDANENSDTVGNPDSYAGPDTNNDPDGNAGPGGAPDRPGGIDPNAGPDRPGGIDPNGGPRPPQPNPGRAWPPRSPSPSPSPPCRATPQPLARPTDLAWSMPKMPGPWSPPPPGTRIPAGA